MFKVWGDPLQYDSFFKASEFMMFPESLSNLVIMIMIVAIIKKLFHDPT